MKSTMEKQFALHMQTGRKPYFEGWYVRVYTKEISFAVIFGIQCSALKKSGFIQFLDTHTNKSSYVEYSWDQIQIQQKPFRIQFGQSSLSLHDVVLHLDNIHAEFLHSALTLLPSTVYMPTIMGPFSYFPMECSHALLSLHHDVHGYLNIQQQHFDLHGIGYMEKDRGVSFPSSYVWFQSNICGVSRSCFFLSFAHIPFLKTSFQGCICLLMIHQHQLRFATYLGCRVAIDEETHQMILRQGSLKLTIHFIGEKGHPLASPIKGNMQGIIRETLKGEAFVLLEKRNAQIGHWHFTHGGLEQHDIMIGS